MQVTRLDNLPACQRIAAVWDCLAHAIPFRRTAWLQSWWEHYQANGVLFVLQVTDQQGAVVGIAPWYLEQSLRHGRVIRPLGSGPVCSEYLSILATDEHRQEVAAALAQWLAAAARGHYGAENCWDLLDLVAWDAADPMLAFFAQHLEAVGNDVFRRPAMSCWRIALPDTWDAYLAAISKSHRRGLQRIDKRWLQPGKARVHTVSTHEQLNSVMDALIRLHQARHRQLGRPGCFASRQFTGFLRSAARELLSEQMLRLDWLEVEGQTLAVEFNLVSDDTLYNYLGGVNTQRTDIAPGNTLLLAALRTSVGEGKRSFDFLRGDEAYKFRWNVREHPCIDLRVVPSRHLAQLRHQAWRAGDTLKHWIRAGLQLARVR
jgi:CelD/BcsL family acetyltransferase involved in cellulose biosynthesis